jgi:hypothetical protein
VPGRAQSAAEAARYNRDADPHRFTVFVEEGGWCGFQDARAMIHGGKLFVGGVQGNGSGAARVGIYDLEAAKPLGVVTLRDNFKRDDHNSPCNVRPAIVRDGQRRVILWNRGD